MAKPRVRSSTLAVLEQSLAVFLPDALLERSYSTHGQRIVLRLSRASIDPRIILFEHIRLTPCYTVQDCHCHGQPGRLQEGNIKHEAHQYDHTVASMLVLEAVTLSAYITSLWIIDLSTAHLLRNRPSTTQ